MFYMFDNSGFILDIQQKFCHFAFKKTLLLHRVQSKMPFSYICVKFEFGGNSQIFGKVKKFYMLLHS
jgi:hypothetical protein